MIPRKQGDYIYKVKYLKLEKIEDVSHEMEIIKENMLNSYTASSPKN